MVKTSLSQDEVIRAIHSFDKRVVTAQEIADRLNFTRQHIDQFLRTCEESGAICSVDVGRCKGWYLEPDHRPAVILTHQLEGIQLSWTAHLACGDCRQEFETGDPLYVLFEQYERRDWSVSHCLCENHTDEIGAREMVDVFNRRKYVGETSDAISFLVASGILRILDEGQVTFHEPNIHEYLPGTSATETRWGYLDS